MLAEEVVVSVVIFLFWVFDGDLWLLWLVVWVIVVVVWSWWWWLSFGGWLDLGCSILGLGLGLGMMKKR